jgi:protein SCO1/2
MKSLYILLFSILLIAACNQVKDNHRLPFLGNHDYTGSDTIYYTPGNFSLLNQDSVEVTPASLEGRIYVADFFFTSCPTICPVMKTQLLRVYDQIKNDQDVQIVSHTIDPIHDDVALLKDFATNLGVSSSHWQFLTGEKDSIYALAQTYMVIADEDSDAPGGFVHSGAFLLLDKERRIRGVYDGTEKAQVDLLMRDIDLLRKEYE